MLYLMTQKICTSHIMSKRVKWTVYIKLSTDKWCHQWWAAEMSCLWIQCKCKWILNICKWWCNKCNLCLWWILWWTLVKDNKEINACITIEEENLKDQDKIKDFKVETEITNNNRMFQKHGALIIWKKDLKNLCHSNKTKRDLFWVRCFSPRSKLY